jgi:hypothetical protein
LLRPYPYLSESVSGIQSLMVMGNHITISGTGRSLVLWQAPSTPQSSDCHIMHHAGVYFVPLLDQLLSGGSLNCRGSGFVGPNTSFPTQSCVTWGCLIMMLARYLTNPPRSNPPGFDHSLLYGEPQVISRAGGQEQRLTVPQPQLCYGLITFLRQSTILQSPLPSVMILSPQLAPKLRRTRRT